MARQVVWEVNWEPENEREVRGGTKAMLGVGSGIKMKHRLET